MPKLRAMPIGSCRTQCVFVVAIGLVGQMACLAGVAIDTPPNRDGVPVGSLDGALATVQEAKPNGVDSDRTAAAWNVVSEATYQDLPRIFAALDQAGPLAANWISMALDRVCATQTAAGQRLPVDFLRETALDTRHALRTRKIALELLGHVDESHVAALQSRFLCDPQAELRRPAIQKKIEEVSDLAQQNIPTSQQLAAWKRLLAAARDADQVAVIARQMKALGQEVDLAAHFGYLVDWRVIGPFDNSDGRGFDAIYPPESLDLENCQGPDGIFSEKSLAGKTGPVVWKAVSASDSSGNVDLNKEIEKLKDVVAYGATLYVSDKKKKVDVRLRVQNSFKIWLNGQLLLAQPVGHTGNSFDQYSVQATLEKGKNLFVIKSCQVDLRGSTEFYENWHFCVRVCDSTGAAILSTDRQQQKGNQP